MQRELNGLVVRSVKYGDTSLILDIYTSENGLETFIVGGARKRKSKMPASLFQLMHWVCFVCYYSENKPIHRIKEASSLMGYTQLPFDLQRRSIGLFMLEILQKTSQGREPNLDLFDMLKETYQKLDKASSFINIHLKFMVDYATFLGIGLQNNWSEARAYFDKQAGIFRAHSNLHTVEKDVSLLLHRLLNNEPQLAIQNLDREKLIEELLHFYRLHIDHFKEPKCLEILKLVLQ